MTITGTRGPRSRRSLRPNMPAAGEGKTSFMSRYYTKTKSPGPPFGATR